MKKLELDINFLYLEETNSLAALVHIKSLSLWERFIFCLSYLFNAAPVHLQLNLDQASIEKMKKATALVS